MVLFFKSKKVVAAKPADAKVAARPKKTVRWANNSGGVLENLRFIEKTGRGAKLGALARTGSKYLSVKDRTKMANKRTADALHRASAAVGQAKKTADNAVKDLKLARKSIAKASKSGAASPFGPSKIVNLENAATDANVRYEIAKMKSMSTRALLLGR